MISGERGDGEGLTSKTIAALDTAKLHSAVLAPAEPGGLEVRGAVAAPLAGLVVRGAEQARGVARGDGLEGRDRGGQDANVDLDDGPVHGARDDVGRVEGRQHLRDVGDADD